MARRWRGLLAIEDEQTGDGRVIAPGALYWQTADFPLAFRWCPEDQGGHGDAVQVGTIDTIERVDGGEVWGTGDLDDEGEHGAELCRRYDAGVFPAGLSIDPDDIEFQVVDTTMEEVDDGQGGTVVQLVAAAGDPDPGADAGVVLYAYNTGDILERWTRARIRACTVVDTAAFSRTWFELDPPAEGQAHGDAGVAAAATALAHAAVHPGCDGTPACSCRHPAAARTQPRLAADALVAAAVPDAPPAAWFEDPRLDRLTPWTVEDSGRVYGHVAAWDTCHVGYANECVTPPRSPSGYAYFNVRPYRTAEGTDVHVGFVTLGTGHASLQLSYRGAASHYDNTGSQGAAVCAGQDAFGPWVAGALLPRLAAQDVRTLRSASVSGDWRPIRSALEMMAVLAVNVPGFPMARVAGAGPDRHVEALVAAGALQVAAERRAHRVGLDAATMASIRRDVRLDLAARARLASAGQELRGRALERLRG